MAKIAQPGRDFGPTEVSGEAPVAPGAPTIVVTAGADSLAVSIDGDTGATHTVLYKLAAASAWSAGGSRTGDGVVTIASLAAGTYHVQAYSTLDGANSAPGNLAISVIVSEAEHDGGRIARLEAWAAARCAAMVHNGQPLFRTAQMWRGQIGGDGSGPESFDRYAPFVFAAARGLEADRQGDYDLNAKVELTLAYGVVGVSAGQARLGTPERPGCSLISDLLIAAFEGAHPDDDLTGGESPLACDELHLSAPPVETVDDVKRCAWELRFALNWF